MAEGDAKFGLLLRTMNLRTYRRLLFRLGDRMIDQMDRENRRSS
jgi:hypothetical protein